MVKLINTSRLARVPRPPRAAVVVGFCTFALLVSSLLTATESSAAADEQIIRHVHLGDSYSAGNGADDYASEPTDCRRSTNAWGMLLGKRIATATGLKVLSENHACSGAIAWDVDHQERLQSATGVSISPEDAQARTKRGTGPARSCEFVSADYVSYFKQRRFRTDECKYFLRPQTDWVTSSTDLVTMTIGGNDLGFKEVVGRCLIVEQLRAGWLGGAPAINLDRSCDEYLDDALARLADTGPNGLESRTRRVLTAVMSRMSPEGLLLVSGYPSLIDGTTLLPGSAPDDTASRIAAGQVDMDAIQQRVVNQLNAGPGTHPRVQFVSPRTDFQGHEIWVPNVSLAEPNPHRWFVAPFADAGLNNYDLWYHPDSEGHRRMASRAQTALATPPSSAAAGQRRPLDIVIVVDTTNSMGDDIASVKESSVALVNSLDEISASWRAAVVSYRDLPSRTGDSRDYPSRVIAPFTNDSADLIDGITSLTLGYGGDGPETMYSGIAAALDLDWRAGVDKRLVVFTDARALDPEPVTGYTAEQIALRALALDPAQIIGIATGGTSASALVELQEVTAIAGGLVTTVGTVDPGAGVVAAVSSLPQDPSAWINGSTTASPGETITLDGSSSVDPAGIITSYEWDVDGDGSVDAAGPSPTVDFSFDRAFSGLSSLRVVSSTGRTGTAVAPLRVTERPDSALGAGDEYFVPLQPTRLLDTRIGLGGPRRRVAAESVVSLPVTGGPSGVPGDAGAVYLSATAVGPSIEGFLTVWPCGQPRPLASNVNFAAGETTANAVITGLGEGGDVCLSSNSETDLVVDISGYVPPGFAYDALVPVRLLDSRDGTGTTRHRLVAGETIELPVLGTAGVPDFAATVALNVTVDRAQTVGHITVWPCGEKPIASSLNYAAGQTVANLSLAGLGPEGSVCLYTANPVDLIVDLQGFVTSPSPYVATRPARLLDTRIGLGATRGYVEAGKVVRVPVPQQYLVDTVGSTPTFNVTVVDALGDGHLTVWPCGTPMPTASNANFTPGETVAAAAVALLDDSGEICLSSNAKVHFVADITGAFAVPERNDGNLSVLS